MSQNSSSGAAAHYCRLSGLIGATSINASDNNFGGLSHNFTSYVDTSSEASMVSGSVLMFVLAGFFFNLNLFGGLSNVGAILGPRVRVLFTSSLSLFLPVMSYLFSEAKNKNNGGKTDDLSFMAGVILTWMLLVELIRKKVDEIAMRGYSGTIHRAGRVVWLGSLVFFNIQSSGRRALFGVLWVLCATKLLQRIAFTEVGKRSYSCGRNPRIINSYLSYTTINKKEKMTQDLDGDDAMMKNCEYIVMGEDDLDVEATPDGYDLKNVKKSLITVAKIWQELPSNGGRIFIGRHADDELRRLCLSFALFKLLRRRFEHLPEIKEKTSQCRDIIFKGLHNNRSNNSNSCDIIFKVMSTEINFLTEYYHSVVPVVLASPFFFLANYFLLPIVVSIVCLMTIILCGGGDVRFAFKSITQDNFTISSGVFNTSICLLLTAPKSPSAFFAAINFAVTFLLTVIYIYEELWEFFVFLLSNWFSVSLLCSYVSHRSCSCLVFRAFVRCIVTVRCWMGFHPEHSLKQFSAIDLRWPPLTLSMPTSFISFLVSTKPMPNNVKNSILNSLISHINAPPPPPPATGRRRSVAEVILIWHVATGLFEHIDPSPTPDKSDNFTVATTLSKYCTYLVAFHPELLPDYQEKAENVYEAMKAELKDRIGCHNYYFSRRSDRAHAMKNPLPSHKLKVKQGVVSKGVDLAKSIEQHDTYKDLDERWKLLKEVWTELLIYVAPSNDEERIMAHKSVLCQGSEFITVLWALMTHIGITCPPTESILDHGVDFYTMDICMSVGKSESDSLRREGLKDVPWFVRPKDRWLKPFQGFGRKRMEARNVVTGLGLIRAHPRRCLVGVLAGAIAATAVTIAFAFFLRPAPLVFSVADARSCGAEENRAAFLNLTLVAGNPTGRAAVAYDALDVVLWYGTTDYIQPNTSLDGGVTTATPLLIQPPQNVTAVEVTARTIEDRFVREIVNVTGGEEEERRKAGPFNVLVVAQVRFKVGVMYTRGYKVRVSCRDVYFFVVDDINSRNTDSTIIGCNGKQRTIPMDYFNGSNVHCGGGAGEMGSFIYNLTASYADQRNEVSIVATSLAMLLLAALLLAFDLLAGAATLRPAARLLLSSSLSLFLPVTSYLFSEAKNNLPGAADSNAGELPLRARLILAWMLLVELLRKKAESTVTGGGGGGGPASRAGRVGFLGYLVFFNVHGAGRKAVFGALWVVAAAKLAQRVAIGEFVKRSFAFGKNPQLIAGYMAAAVTTAMPDRRFRRDEEIMKSCNYAVTGEEKLERQPGPNGYLVNAAAGDDDDEVKVSAAVVTVGRIYSLAESDELLTSDPKLKRLCLSYALFKLLRRELDKKSTPLTVTETDDCRHLIFTGLFNDVTAAAAADTIFEVITDELGFVTEYYHSVLPVMLASQFFLLVNYILFPVVVLGLCLMTVILCGNGDVAFIAGSIKRDNYAVSFGLVRMTRCLVSRIFRSPSALFSSIDLSITLLLFLTILYEEAWELVVFLLSDWLTVSMICDYVIKPPCRIRRAGIRGVQWVNRRIRRRNILRVKQFSLLWFLPKVTMRLPTAAVPEEAKRSIIDYLAAFDGGGGGDVLTAGKSAVARMINSSRRRVMTSACESDSVAEVILTWHIATSLLEVRCPSPAARFTAATRLSRYCAYLVAFRREMLPDDVDCAASVYGAVKSELKKEMGIKGYYFWTDATRYEKMMAIVAAGGGGEDDGEAAAEEEEMTVVRKGVRLGKALMEEASDGGGEAAVWKVVGDVWTEIVVYVAAAAAKGGGEQVSARGGELVTLLWALLTHTGIARAAPPRDGRVIA
uniref:DUF4220 domain-containing protein n=1 Tax=Leersia perrieri TaxID=77586 RepID=A0A0D9WL66_9ORYZ